MIDMQPAAARLAGVIAGVSDDDLAKPTPCPDASVGGLIDHIRTFSVAFTRSARKEGRDGPPPQANPANLPGDWRQTTPDALATLAAAWGEPGAWDGMSHAGPIEMSADMAGLVAVDELVVHGWDIAVATGQPYDVSDDEVAAAMSFVANFHVPRDGGLFGPIVDVPEDAPPLDRLLGLTGRDPNWQPPAS
ncbi:MAG TPA: TIGR03086 family metal-binding protein [Acidimicrobiales bacterium]|nr:TIGR03086 family metal-binding protein [Acidimicrobiales bacterium]